MSKKLDHMKFDIADYVTDPKTKRRYKKGKFLGRVSPPPSPFLSWYSPSDSFVREALQNASN